MRCVSYINFPSYSTETKSEAHLNVILAYLFESMERFINYLTSDEPLKSVFRHLANGANPRRFVTGADVAADLAPPNGITEGKSALTRWLADS
jgi:hypothetical protein